MGILELSTLLQYYQVLTGVLFSHLTDPARSLFTTAVSFHPAELLNHASI